MGICDKNCRKYLLTITNIFYIISFIKGVSIDWSVGAFFFAQNSKENVPGSTDEPRDILLLYFP
jgi:hypothetical protein